MLMAMLIAYCLVPEVRAQEETWLNAKDPGNAS